METALFRVREDTMLSLIGHVCAPSTEMTEKLLSFLAAIGEHVNGIAYCFNEGGQDWCLLIEHLQGVNVVEFGKESYDRWNVDYHLRDGDSLGRKVWGRGFFSYREYALTAFAELVTLSEAGRSITDARNQPQFTLEKAHALLRT
jgi:hypothetical protein